jgi:hypothetical protein
MLTFIVFSEWMTLPAGSIYWNLWAFYLPFVILILLLTKAAAAKQYPAGKIHLAVFGAALIKVLFNGFEAITAAFLMITVPLVYYAVRDKWEWNIFAARMLRLGLVLAVVVALGVVILSIQIAAHDKGFSGSYTYILETLNRRAIGSPEDYPVYAESMEVGILAVIWKYLNIHALTLTLFQWSWQLTYLHLVAVFAVVTALFFLPKRFRMEAPTFNKGQALIAATWYSISAPLSWLILFKPTSYIHDTIFPIIWQMPFTLLGVALVGFVLGSFFKLRILSRPQTSADTSQPPV